MLAGNAANTDPKKVSSGNICHRCWTSTNEGIFVGGAPCTGSDTVDIPQDTKCKMIRQTIIFPTYVFFFSVLFPLQCSVPDRINDLVKTQLLGRQEPRLSRPQVACRLWRRFRCQWWRLLPFHASRQATADHVRAHVECDELCRQKHVA